MWILDRTKTKFGARLLKSWVGRPLVDMTYVQWLFRPTTDYNPRRSFDSILRDRIDAVEEIISSGSEKLVILRDLLKNIPDLAKGLCRIQYGKVGLLQYRVVWCLIIIIKCTPQELSVLLPAFNKIAVAFDGVVNLADVGFQSHLLNGIILSLPKLKQPIQGLLSAISLKKAAEGRMDTLWTDPERYPVIADIDIVRRSTTSLWYNLRFFY